MSEEEYRRSLSAVVQKIRTAMTIKQSLERHIQLARKTGRNDLEIGDDIRRELRGELPDDTIRKYLPASLKHQEKTNTRYAGLIPHPKEPDETPKLPPPHQEIRETEVHTQPQPQPEPPQAESSIAILDCLKFSSELRIGLMNNAKLRLQLNNSNDKVIAIE